MSKTQSIITYHIKNQENVTNSWEKRRPTDASPEMMSELTDFKTHILARFHEVKASTLDINGKRDILSREIRTIKQRTKISEPKNTI